LCCCVGVPGLLVGNHIVDACSVLCVV
jgi:hypothetical protein